MTAVLAAISFMQEDFSFEPAHFYRFDEGNDAEFYSGPRLVKHLDDEGIELLTNFYRQIIPSGGAILDLMSSWISHLPEELIFDSIVGLGMNAIELNANSRLDKRALHDLNADPDLPFQSESFDVCLIALSVQYLTRPVDVFNEIARVLKPEGKCIVSFSNRCFPTKAIRVWQTLDDEGHIWLVKKYFESTGLFNFIYKETLSSGEAHKDPLFAVVAQKQT